MQNKEQSRRYRLVWFQRYNKAGGSSVISTAAQNAKNFYPRHSKGNPVDADGWGIPIWWMTSKAQNALLDNGEDVGVTFVTSELDMQDYVALCAAQQAARGDLGLLYRKAMVWSGVRNGISRFREKFETRNPMDRELFNDLKESG